MERGFRGDGGSAQTFRIVRANRPYPKISVPFFRDLPSATSVILPFFPLFPFKLFKVSVEISLSVKERIQLQML
jgi:hypothetical protein